MTDAAHTRVNNTMLDHLGIAVPTSKFQEVVNFYIAALAPLGITKQLEFGGVAVGLGASKVETRFWVFARDENHVTGLHLAFSAKSHAEVDKFHEEAIKTGGTDNGKPGIRSMYHPNYYAAFIVDPVGYVQLDPVIRDVCTD
jgi:hypothetical protein